MAQARVYEINEIHAMTTTNNIASQIVLEKSGFSREKEAETTTVDLNGENVNFVHYIWRAIKD